MFNSKRSRRSSYEDKQGETDQILENESAKPIAAEAPRLTIRGLKTRGLKAELQALIYSAAQFGYEVKPTEVEEDRSRSANYGELLIFKGKRIPDPLVDLEDNWIPEKEGVKFWPPLHIYRFLNILHNPLGRSRSLSGQQTQAKDLINTLYPSCKKSTVFKYLEDEQSITEIKTTNYTPEENFNVGDEVEVQTRNTFNVETLSSIGNHAESVEAFFNVLPTYSQEQVDAVEKQTRGQAENNQWAKFRAGMMTASNLKSVVTRQASLSDPASSRSQDPRPTIKRLMGYETLNPNLQSLKYGRLMELVSRKTYETILKENGHQDVQVEECGLFIDRSKVFLDASPDGLVSCACCDETGLLEIKCPRSIALDEPSAENLDWLTVINGSSQLKKNHQYYYQVQSQMGITGRIWCKFFVYTQAGFHLKRIYYDIGMGTSAVDVVEQFFRE
eukprot:XP_011672057.1 PREDICTED: uncharacterized protein LOC105442031 [Strongylocentrotus purpuratus]